MVHEFIPQIENSKWHKVFSKLDENKDGHLEFKELFKAYQQIHGKNACRKEVKKIFDKLDADKNGSIDYNEFLTAVCDKDDLCTDTKLQEVFDFFDLDGDG